MSRATFLAFLLSLGTKLPTLWPLILAWVEATKALYEAAAGPIDDGQLQMVQLSAEEAEAEAQIAALLVGEGSQAAFDGSRLRAVFAILQATGAMDFFAAWLKAKAGL